MDHWRKFTAVAALSVACLAVAPAQAQEYPDGQVRYILHVKPGGATDVMARKLSEGLQKLWGQTVVVENRDGGSGARQMAQLTRAKPDGMTIGSVTASHLGMFEQSNQFNLDSVEWACGLVLDPYLLAVPADSKINNLEDLAKVAKAEPGSLSIAGFGERSGGQIAWRMIEDAIGLAPDDINWVPYDSVGNAVVAALGGHNDVVISYIGLVRQQVEAGNLKVIGIMSDTRAEMLPDVKTFGEQGYKVDTTWQQFRGVIMPAGTPLEVQQKFCSAAEKVMNTDDMKAYIADAELIPAILQPEAFNKFVHGQSEATVEWVKRIDEGK